MAVIKMTQDEFDNQVKLLGLEVKTQEEVNELIKSSKDELQKSTFDELNDEEKESYKQNLEKSLQGFVMVEVLSRDMDSLDKSIKTENKFVRNPAANKPEEKPEDKPENKEKEEPENKGE